MKPIRKKYNEEEIQKEIDRLENELKPGSEFMV